MSDYKAIAASLRACTDPQKRHAADVIDALFDYAEELVAILRTVAIWENCAPDLQERIEKALANSRPQMGVTGFTPITELVHCPACGGAMDAPAPNAPGQQSEVMPTVTRSGPGGVGAELTPANCSEPRYSMFDADGVCLACGRPSELHAVVSEKKEG